MSTAAREAASTQIAERSVRLCQRIARHLHLVPIPSAMAKNARIVAGEIGDPDKLPLLATQVAKSTTRASRAEFPAIRNHGALEGHRENQ
ncbi:MAG: hypothetical protein ACRECE_07320 [Xanthobacteraceae bacterium]